MQKLTNYKKNVSEKWYLVDATNIRLGVLSSEVAKLLLAKNEAGRVDYDVAPIKVVVTNTDEISYHPKKAKNKIYYRHSGYQGALKQRTLADQMDRDSKKVVRDAISGMLPKTKLRDVFLNNLYVYAGNDYDQKPQQPKIIEFNK